MKKLLLVSALLISAMSMGGCVSLGVIGTLGLPAIAATAAASGAGAAAGDLAVRAGATKYRLSRAGQCPEHRSPKLRQSAPR
jgi:hypothetical protein